MISRVGMKCIFRSRSRFIYGWYDAIINPVVAQIFGGNYNKDNYTHINTHPHHNLMPQEGNVIHLQCVFLYLVWRHYQARACLSAQRTFHEAIMIFTGIVCVWGNPVISGSCHQTSSDCLHTLTPSSWEALGNPPSPPLLLDREEQETKNNTSCTVCVCVCVTDWRVCFFILLKKKNQNIINPLLLFVLSGSKSIYLRVCLDKSLCHDSIAWIKITQKH